MRNNINGYAAQADTIYQYVWAYRKRLVPGLSFAFLRSLMLAPLPWLFRVIVDEHLASADLLGIASVVFVFIGLLFLHYVFAVKGARAIARVMANMNMDMRSMIYHKLQFLSFGFLDQQKTGRLISKYAFDTLKVEQTLMQLLNQFLPNVLYSLMIITFLVTMNWQLALVLVAMLPLYGFARFYFFEKFRLRNQQARLAQEHLTGTASELITALRLVRSFGEEKQARDQLDVTSENLARSRFELISVNQSFGAFTQVSTQALSLFVIAGGAILVMNNMLTLCTLFAFMVAMPIILQPVQMFAQVSEQYFVGQEAYRSIKELLNSTYVEEWKGQQRIPSLRGDIKFESVSFAYPSKQERVIENFSLHIRPGEHIAFVGPSGSGKSTLANLVLGLYKPTSGVIKIDDCPQELINMRWFRRQVAIVMQESLLLSGSIRENIRFAKPDATDEEVRQAAREANAEAFINELPEGYESEVGERGVSLSGGQRQRISIARAILRDPKVLILDEATSALDYESERLIQEALERLAHGRTVITIAHRLSTIRNADRIVVLRKGRIIESGKFEDLVERGGYFKELLYAQDRPVMA